MLQGGCSAVESVVDSAMQTQAFEFTELVKALQVKIFMEFGSENEPYRLATAIINNPRFQWTVGVTLTKFNARVGAIISCKHNPGWGTFRLDKDGSGWIRVGDRGRSILPEGEFHFWYLVGERG